MPPWQESNCSRCCCKLLFTLIMRRPPAAERRECGAKAFPFGEGGTAQAVTEEVFCGNLSRPSVRTGAPSPKGRALR